MQGALGMPPKHPAGAGLMPSAKVDRRSRVDDQASPGRLITAVGPSAPRTVASPTSTGAPRGSRAYSAGAPVLPTARKEIPAIASDKGSTKTPVSKPNDPKGLTEEASDISTAGPGVSQSGDRNAATPITVSAAMSEDLAYAFRGSTLQSYAITGSVLVAASTGACPRLRVTDEHGHIAKSTVNAVVAEETASTTPTKEYLWKNPATQPAGATGVKFIPTLMYRCSPAVKELPVRVVCRLRTSEAALFVWAQIIANPNISRPLSGVSVLVHLPFSPLQEQVEHECLTLE